MNPHVTFIVPCYNLSHLLAECVDSILLQTYRDFEVLIMDDCSPDKTAEVASSFTDPRVRHVRNEINLGNLANFNKGIDLARGKYIWLISADDRIRSTSVLERYVLLLERHPEVGFVCCPAIKLEDDQEKELLQFSVLESNDMIISGRQLLMKLLESNPIVAPAAMARKECYTRISMFPLDLPYAGDWYMWCVFALYYDVAYFSEPMVNYRHHSLSLTNILKAQDKSILFYNTIAVLSRISDRARKAGMNEVVAKCNLGLMTKCVNRFIYKDGTPLKTGPDEVDEILKRCEFNLHDREQLSIRIYVELADHYYSAFETRETRNFYVHALRINWVLPEVWLKYMFLYLGTIGRKIRELISAARSNVRDAKATAIK